jgi:urease accessory protein
MSRALRARAVVGAEADGAGGTRVHTLRSDGPLALRQAGGAVYLVGAAAGPLGGDRLELYCTVGAGAVLRLRSAAATLLLPGGDGVASGFEQHVQVAAGGYLDVALQPLIASRGCRHRQRGTVSLADGASLRWREELVLGRHDETPGECRLRQDVVYGARPLLRHELCIGPDRAFASRAVLGRARAVGSLLLAGPRWRYAAEPFATEHLVITPLAGPGVLALAVAGDAAELRRQLDFAEQRLQCVSGGGPYAAGCAS